MVNDDMTTLRFQDFISEYLKENRLECSRLIKLDLERLLQLKLRDFSKLAKQKLCISDEILQKVANNIFDLSFNEKYGILGARINLKILKNDGTLIEIARFSYDPCTLSSFEIFITLKEHQKRLLSFGLFKNNYNRSIIKLNDFDYSKRTFFL